MQQDVKNVWLEPVLAEHLRPVEAPRELWSRMQDVGKPVSTTGLRLGWVVVAAMLLVAAASALLRAHGASPALSLESSSAPEIQAWVKENTGLDVPFPAQLPGTVRLSGARLAPKGVEVDYFVRNRPERLLIAQADPSGPAGHRFAERNAKKVSWSMGGQFYAVDCAAPEDAEAACLLCHT